MQENNKQENSGEPTPKTEGTVMKAEKRWGKGKLEFRRTKCSHLVRRDLKDTREES